MIQPKYSPKEALERVKLMMKYDSSKTLTENEENIKPQIKEDTAGAAVGGTLASAGAGAAYGGLASAGALGGLGTTAAGTSMAVGSALLPASAGAGTAVALGAGILAGAAGLAVIPLAYWLIRKDSGSASSVKKLFQMCSSEAGKIAKLPRKINNTKIRNLADDINDAVNYQTLGFMAGTDEEKLFGAFRSLRNGTASDACALVNRYNSEYGDLYDDIDGDIDSPDEWKQIYRPLRDCIEDSLLTIKDPKIEQDCKKNPKQPKCGGTIPKPKPTPGKSKFKKCAGTYSINCVAGPIKTVQACLGLTADGKFGPKTQEKLKSLGYTSFTDADVTKICGKKNEVEGEAPEVSGEDIKISTSDTNF
jgi:hypothetical protein